MKKILFVCTGNTCRSSMAEGIFKDSIRNHEELMSEYSASSAGLAAFEGDRASENAVRALNEEWGIDISSHRARRLSEEQLRESEIILTMTRSHKNSIISAMPGLKSKVFTLKEYISDKGANSSGNEYDYSLDIVDPYGMSLNVYKKCAQDIKTAVEKLISKLRSE